ncbi:MAG: ATP synthase F1 subunit delta [Campylobacterota bacterium]|nr:ATP synthase F1 subunit delta [Campylobacterota bacterium]
MRGTEKIARRYAKSLMKLCEDYRYNYDDAGNSIENLIETLKANEELMSVLKSPIVTKEKKIDIFSKVFQILEMSEGSQKFVEYLIVNRRGDILENIYFSFSEMVDKKLGRAKAKVKSVVSLSIREEREIKQFLEKALGKTIEIEGDIDKDIIGGLWIQVGDIIFDGSVRGFLSHLKKKVINMEM